MKQESKSSHQARLGKVCDYIGRHLDEDLNLDKLAAIGAMSRFHFHRVFQAATGAPLSRYVLLLRLKRASFRLAFEPRRKILDIGLEAGFDSAEAFSRAFKRVLGQSPSAFRRSPGWPDWHLVMNQMNPAKGEMKLDIKIVDLPTQQIAYLEHCGDPSRVLETAGRFIEWRKTSGLSPVDKANTYGIPNGDPKTMAAEDFRFRICGTVGEAIPANDFGVQNGSIPAGRYAVVRHLGSHDAMDDSIYAFFRDWLPQSGEALREEPLFFHYLNFVHQVDECDLQTDIYLPLM
ncbi:AraC family transcriptional regulator [Shewanella cyperi]|uniref:AraC family transcriptional regulator n=1 Tax=Shewanella cyperi TaxID=2814292 RepID=A0A974XKP5_9GAMM|nr:AraC family transcriptional regulator [Shewanella cyperi]QSX30169.1 AraC family transcriptional regulator [Shewanella cyperi]